MKKAISILLTAALAAAPLTAMAKDITLKIGSESATVDGETVTLDSAPVIQNDRTMLPIRFIAENFGFDVIWNAALQEVTISSKEKESKNMNIKFKTDEEIKAENSWSDNAFGLVYDGAITENKDGEVNIHPITYTLNGVTIAANVYHSYCQG